MASRAFYQGGPMGARLNFTDNLLSPAQGKSLWQTCPLLEYLCDPFLLHWFEDDFDGISKAADTWIATQATSGSATAGVLAGGTCALSAGATTDHQGEQIQKAGGGFIPAVGKHIWFETRLKINVLTAEIFYGLADIDTTIIAADAIHATDYIAFSAITDDGVLIPGCSSGSVATNNASPKTLVAATYVRLGFVLTSNTSLQFYVDGVAAGAAITTNIPSVVITPSFVCQATGTGTPVVDIDYVCCAQLR
jgi:hypothetical protein